MWTLVREWGGECRESRILEMTRGKIFTTTLQGEGHCCHILQKAGQEPRSSLGSVIWRPLENSQVFPWTGMGRLQGLGWRGSDEKWKPQSKGNIKEERQTVPGLGICRQLDNKETGQGGKEKAARIFEGWGEVTESEVRVGSKHLKSDGKGLAWQSFGKRGSHGHTKKLLGNVDNLVRS